MRDTDKNFRLEVHKQLVSIYEEAHLDYKLIRNDLDVYSDFIPTEKKEPLIDFTIQHIPV